MCYVALSIAKTWAAADASFSWTSSNSPSVLAELFPRLARARRPGCRQNLGGPGATGAKRRAAEVEHGQRDAQSLADRAQNVFARDVQILERKPAVAVPRMPHFGMRASTTSNPGMSGVTRNAVTLPSGSEATGVRAMTVSTWAMPPLVM